MTERPSDPPRADKPSSSLIYRLHNWCNKEKFGGDIVEDAQELMSEAAEALTARSAGGLFDQDKVKRLLAVMECDTLDDAIMEAEFDVKESVAAALAIKLAAGHPEQVWPSPHERRFFIALKDEAARAAQSASERRTDELRYAVLRRWLVDENYCVKGMPQAMWGCREHWFKLPKSLRDSIWKEYRPGQEEDGTPSPRYLIVAELVQEWIAGNVRVHPDDRIDLLKDTIEEFERRVANKIAASNVPSTNAHHSTKEKK